MKRKLVRGFFFFFLKAQKNKKKTPGFLKE